LLIPHNLIFLNAAAAEVTATPDLPIIINIALALAAALGGGLIARWLKLPAIVGFLVGGVIIGPFTPGYVGDMHTVHQLAELGVIFLLFGVGLHFSLKDLWEVRKIAIPGALLQMSLTSVMVLLISMFWGWSLAAAIVVGLAVSIASTVVLLRNLMDRGLLNTSHGRIAVGWLIMEDLATVAILVLLPAFAGGGEGEPIWQTAGIAIFKAAVFAVLMLVVGKRVLPWVLSRIAHLGSRELFIVSVLVMTLGTALGAAYLFGVSLALGAFLAGVVVSESHYSHQVEAEILPFRETFAVLFFVSVGMLVNPLSLLEQFGQVLTITALIVVGKGLLTLVIGIILAAPARTSVVIAVSLSQIGEFSFLLGQAGVNLGILTEDQYSLLLSGALVSIALNPFIFMTIPWLERTLAKTGPFWKLLNRGQPLELPRPEVMRNHAVVVGYGRVGQHIVEVLSELKVPFIVVELDAGRLNELTKKGIPALYGDAGSSEILNHAHLKEARVVVVTLPNETAAASVVATIRHTAPEVPVVVRAANADSVIHLTELGATQVVYPELEGSLEIMEQTLLRLGYQESNIFRFKEAIRHDRYNLAINSAEEREALATLLNSVAVKNVRERPPELSRAAH
jgi:CPA2 family monovalent cation:H+ antiporter-2